MIPAAAHGDRREVPDASQRVATLDARPPMERVSPATDAGPATHGSRCSVDVVSDVETFLGMAAEWNETVERAAVPHPFLRHEWLRVWWECFGESRRLHILVVRAQNSIIAIAPLMAEVTHMYGVPVRQLDFLHNDHTPRADVIVAERAADAYLAIWHALRDEQAQWDVLRLGRLLRASTTIAAFRTLAEADGCATGLWHGDESPYLALTGTWSEYTSGLSAKFRSNIRNRLTRLARIGEAGVEVLRDAGAIQQACADAVRLEASGWKHSEGTAISADAAIERFYTRLSKDAGEEGWLRLLFLTVGGRRIASAYSARYANRLLLVKTGYDPEFATCAPFKLLTHFAIRDAFADRLSEVDFLGNSEPWKQEWTDTARPHDWLYVFSNARRGRLLHSLKFRVAPAVKQWRA